MKTIDLHFENGLCLIGVLETMKRLDKPKYSKIAAEYLDEYFTYYDYMCSEIPIKYINKLEDFFTEYFNEFKDEGVITPDGTLQATYWLQNFDMDMDINGECLLNVMLDWWGKNSGKIKEDED